MLCPDLLFGSKVQGMLAAAGHEVVAVASAGEAEGADALVVDLHTAVDRLEDVPALGFYSHVDRALGEAAERAGCEPWPRGKLWRSLEQLLQSDG